MAPDATYTSSYSMDIIIKICATLITFLIFLFISAWHITRKKYTHPPLVATKTPIENIRDLVKGSFLNDCYLTGGGDSRLTHINPVSATIFQNKMAIVVNDLDWLMQNKSSFIFTVPFSLASKCLKNSWRGLLFNRDSRDKDVLLCLMIKGFESLDWRVIHKSLNFGLTKSKLNDVNFSFEISALLIAFESIFGYTVDDTKLEKKLVFINELSVILNEFSSFFYHGKSLSEDFEVKEIIEKLEELLNPVIESSIYHCDSQYHEDLSTLDVCPNLLSQIAFLRHHLNEENINSHNITIDDFSHCLFEHFFILSEIIAECLQGLWKLVESSPEIIDVISRELRAEAASDNKGHRILLTEHHLESCNSLVFTKSTTQELIRLLCLGSQFDLSLAERDGQLEEYDMQEFSVVVFNHFAFCRNRCFGVDSVIDGEQFKPGRFVKHDPNLKKYVFFNTCQLVTFQDQYNLVGIPRNYICRILLLMLIKYVSPEHDIDLDFKMDNYLQFELLFDINKQFCWNRKDLIDCKT